MPSKTTKSRCAKQIATDIRKEGYEEVVEETVTELFADH